MKLIGDAININNVEVGKYYKITIEKLSHTELIRVKRNDKVEKSIREHMHVSIVYGKVTNQNELAIYYDANIDYLTPTESFTRINSAAIQKKICKSHSSNQYRLQHNI